MAIKISDTGIRIAEADPPHIFYRFYRVDKARTMSKGGSGLGLSLSQWIVAAHRGKIHFNRKVSKRATVTISLPLTFSSK